MRFADLYRFNARFAKLSCFNGRKGTDVAVFRDARQFYGFIIYVVQKVLSFDGELIFYYIEYRYSVITV